MRSSIKKALLFVAMLIPWIANADPGAYKSTAGYETTDDAPMYCHSGLQISINALGFAVILPQMLLVETFPNYDNFIVTIVNPPLATDTVTCAHVGMTIDVMVTDTSTGNSCWSAVTVEDKLKPIIECDTVILPCTIDPFQLPDSVGPTSLSDNCTDSADLVLTFNQTTMTINCMTGSPYVFKITRNYTVTDASGNSSSCTQIILFRKGSLAEVVFPPDTVLSCPTTNTGTDVTGEPTIYGLPIANLCMIAQAHMDEIIPKCGNSYVIKRKFTLTDWCTTLSRIHTQIIEVKDTIPPTIYCPADMTVEASMNCLANFTLPTINGTDACADDASIMYTYIVDGMPTGGPTLFNLALGPHTIQVIGYDPCFNYDTCSFVVTVVDTESPTLTCVPATVTLNAMGMAVVDYSYFTDNWYYDNCGLIDTMIRRVNSDCGNPNDQVFGETIKFCCADVGQMVMVAIKVTDINGNMGICMFGVDVQDIYGPTIQCPPDLTINCDQVDDGLYYGSPTITAGCPVTIDSTETTVIDDCGRGAITRVFRATGISGNVDSCIQIITVINPFDFTNDSLMFPPDTLLTVCNPDTSPASLGTPVILDNFCGNITSTYRDSIPDPNAACLKIFRIWEVFNACDTVAMFMDIQMITIKNNAPPVIMAPPNQTFNVGPNCDVLVDLAAVTFDTCSTDITVTNDYNNQGGDITNITLTPGTYTITFTATNACGRTAIDQTIITVRDITPPVIVCPGSVTLDCPADTSVGNTGLATVTDNCLPNPTISYSDVVTPGACPNTMSIVRTFTAVDAYNNVATCEQIINVVDDTDPVISCPPNRTLNCPGDTAVANTGMATATEECNSPAVISYSDNVTPGSCPNTFTVARTWSATDACGNTSTCQQTIIVIDDTDPIITCPGNMTLNCPADTSVNVTGMATAMEECNEPANITYNDVVVAGSCSNTFTVFRTWTAMDICGNASTCVQTLNVIDDTDPIITCPGNMTLSCPADTSTSVTGVGTATDECNNPPVVTYNDVVTPGACANTFTVNRTWTANDACGNTSSCVQIIIVQDITDPVINCPGNVTLDCPADTSTANTGVATATDECNNPPVITYADAVTAGACTNTFTVLRTWTATDACSNTSSCVQTIIVRDVTDPVINCPANVTLSCPADTSTANTGVATATDACNNPPSVAYSDVVNGGNCTSNYSINRTWTATDACGNTASCVQTITVQDITNPTITCPADITIDCPGDTTTTNTGAATANDGCSTATISYSDVVTQGSCPNNFSVVRTWKATDACGNMAQCNQSIVVVDVTDPLITCPVDTTLTCNADTSPANTGFPIISDECNEPPTVTYNDVITPGSGAVLFTITRTWTVTDACGNMNTCVQTIVVTDAGAPTIDCPADITAYLTPDSCQIFVAVPEPTVSDDCGDVTVTNNGNGDDLLNASGIYPLGTVVITYIAIDGSGNADTCQTSITVLDTISPTIVCPVDMSADCNDDLFPLSQFGTPTIDDNCMNPSITSTDSTVTINDCGVGTILRTFVVSDAAGNTAFCAQTITVTGNSVLDSLDFIWPADTIASFDCVDINGVPLILPFLDPNLTTCDVIGVDSTITQIVPATYGCLTYTVDYTVTDSCNFDPNTGAGQWTFTQLVGIFDTIAPVINPITGGTYIADSMCMAFVSLPAVTASDNCSNVVITNNSPFANNGGANATGTYPGGNTNVLFTAMDVCGNTDTFSLDIFVTDTSAPVLICIKTEVQITDDLTVSILASELGIGINSIEDNCTVPLDITITYTLNDPTDTVRVFDCNDVGIIERIKVYSIDAQGNIDSCVSEYGIDDPNGFCPSSRPIMIAGHVTNPLKDALENVEVYTMMDGHMEMDMSDEEGDFMFEEAPSNVIHRLDASYNDPYLNGVTAYDLSILFRHIADIDQLTDPYLYYAADVNGDKIIDIRDVLELRKLLLGIQDDLPIPSWTFYDAAYDLSSATNPFYYDVHKYVMVYHNREDYMDADFIGVKSGDLDYSAETSFIGSDDRAAPSSIVFGQAMQEIDGSYRVPVFMNGDLALAGGQLEIDLNENLEILEIVPNENLALESTEINQNLLQRNKIRMVWIAEREVQDFSEPIFWVRVGSSIKPDGNSWELNASFRNELFDLNGNKFNAELQVLDVESSNEQESEGFALFQNVPNPFKGSSIVQFALPESSTYELSIFDAQGAQLYLLSGEGQKGMNVLEINNQMLGGNSGVLYYRLKTENNNAVRKMIVNQ